MAEATKLTVCPDPRVEATDLKARAAQDLCCSLCGGPAEYLHEGVDRPTGPQLLSDCWTAATRSRSYCGAKAQLDAGFFCQMQHDPNAPLPAPECLRLQATDLAQVLVRAAASHPLLSDGFVRFLAAHLTSVSATPVPTRSGESENHRCTISLGFQGIGAMQTAVARYQGETHSLIYAVLEDGSIYSCGWGDGHWEFGISYRLITLNLHGHGKALTLSWPEMTVLSGGQGHE